jgi:hypothetical protein
MPVQTIILFESLPFGEVGGAAFFPLILLHILPAGNDRYKYIAQGLPADERSENNGRNL